jgi:hypothetical protein
MSSADDLQSRLYGYREKLSKLDGLLSSDPTNESFMSLKARLVTAITEVEAAITAATASAQTASRLASSSAAASAATASAAAAASAATAAAAAAAAAAAQAQRKPYTSAVISSAPVRSSLSLQGGVGQQGGAAEGGGAAVAAVKPAFRLVAAVGGAKRSRGAEGEGDAAADAAAEEAAESKGQYADLHIPDNLKIHLTDVRARGLTRRAHLSLRFPLITHAAPTPTHLVPRHHPYPLQTEEQKQRKQKKIKALKLQHRQKASEDMARAATNSWQAFQSMARR